MRAVACDEAFRQRRLVTAAADHFVFARGCRIGESPCRDRFPQAEQASPTLRANNSTGSLPALVDPTDLTLPFGRGAIKVAEEDDSVQGKRERSVRHKPHRDPGRAAGVCEVSRAANPRVGSCGKASMEIQSAVEVGVQHVPVGRNVPDSAG